MHVSKSKKIINGEAGKTKDNHNYLVDNFLKFILL